MRVNECASSPKISLAPPARLATCTRTLTHKLSVTTDTYDYPHQVIADTRHTARVFGLPLAVVESPDQVLVHGNSKEAVTILQKAVAFKLSRLEKERLHQKQLEQERRAEERRLARLEVACARFFFHSQPLPAYIVDLCKSKTSFLTSASRRLILDICLPTSHS